MRLFKFISVILICQTLSWFIVQRALAVEEGTLAPAYDIRLMNGQSFSSSEGAGKVVVLHFWASWCVPCRTEMPAMEHYYNKHHQEGLELVAISMDDPNDVQMARDMMKSYSFPGALIRESRVKGYGRIWRIPLTFVIDRQGILRRDAWDGEAGIDEAVLEKTITPLLTKK